MPFALKNEECSTRSHLLNVASPFWSLSDQLIISFSGRVHVPNRSLNGKKKQRCSLSMAAIRHCSSSWTSPLRTRWCLSVDRLKEAAAGPNLSYTSAAVSPYVKCFWIGNARDLENSWHETRPFVLSVRIVLSDSKRMKLKSFTGCKRS